MRRVLVAVVLIGLTGCSPADRTGVTVDPRGLPVAINCGTWIFGMEVTDADTGRVVWAASARELESGGMATRADVALGQLPSPTWVHDSPLKLEPRPSTWRLRVDSTNDVVIDVQDADLEEGVVHRPNGGSETRAHFDGQTCSGLPISQDVLRAAFGFIVLVALLAFASMILRRRRATAGTARA